MGVNNPVASDLDIDEKIELQVLYPHRPAYRRDDEADGTPYSVRSQFSVSIKMRCRRSGAKQLDEALELLRRRIRNDPIGHPSETRDQEATGAGKPRHHGPNWQ